MVLKRILTTALGALGLGALVAGTASGQTAGEGNIPAPDIFDDQITCSMHVPTTNPMPTAVDGMTSPLDDLIGMGTTELTTAALTAAITDSADLATALETLGNLGYVIPPMGSNCGAGTDTPAFNAVTVGMADTDPDTPGNQPSDDYNPGEGAIPTDVAEGYTELLGKFMDVYGDPGDNDSTGTAGVLADAQKALSDQIEAGTTGSALEPFQNAVTEAQAAHTKAQAAFSAISGGPINRAGVAEWMAKAAVTKSVADYNAQVTSTNMALTNLNDMNYADYDDGAIVRSKYVPLGNDELFTTVVTIANGMGTVVDTQLVQYTNSNLAVTTNAGMAGVPAMGTTDAMASDSTNGNFTASGRLIIPMEPWDHDSDTGTAQVLRTTVDADNHGVDQIRTRVENVRIAAAAIKKARDEYIGTQQDVYDEAYRRAKLELDYYEALWSQVLADTTDTRTDANKLAFVDTDSDGVRDEGELDNATYMANPVTIASRNAAYISASNKRVAAEQDLRSKVAAREMATAAVVKQFTSPQSFYAQLVARRTALKAEKDKIVADAETPTDAQTKAAADAAKALTEAEMARDDLQGLFDDPGNPKVALIDELLKTDGDDGQALVDAISSNYDTANEAKMKADEVEGLVSGLTGDEGLVETNRKNIADNREDIDAHTRSIDHIESEIWGDAGTDGMSRIDRNEADIMTLNGEVFDENGMSRIDANETRSMANAMEIGLDADGNGTVMLADGMMGSRIDANEERSEINQMAIFDENGMSRIATNKGLIDGLDERVGMAESDINGLSGRVGSAESAINRNETAIMGLQDQMEIVRAGVAASMALAGMPAINGRGISIGVGSYDGESAFAVGFQIQGEMASFKVGVTSAGGETGASAGVGFQF